MLVLKNEEINAKNIIAVKVACSRLSDSGEDAKEKGTRKVGRAGKRKKEGRVSPALPSFLPFYFRVCAFSIQRTQLSRSLVQATVKDATQTAWKRKSEYSRMTGLIRTLTSAIPV